MIWIILSDFETCKTSVTHNKNIKYVKEGEAILFLNVSG